MNRLVAAIRPYFPSLFLVSLAFFFAAVPFLAVFLVVGGLLFAAIAYGWIVHKIRSVPKTTLSKDGTINAEFRRMETSSPGMGDVRVYIRRYMG